MLRKKLQPPWLGMLRNNSRPLRWVCYVTSPAYLLKRECNGEIVGEIINHSAVEKFMIDTYPNKMGGGRRFIDD